MYTIPRIIPCIFTTIASAIPNIIDIQSTHHLPSALKNHALLQPWLKS